MSSIYSPVMHAATGLWLVGRIEDHVAKPLSSEEVHKTVNLLNDLERLPRIVCLCGSTRFLAEFRQANLEETLAGRIVLSIGCDTKSDDDLGRGQSPEEFAEWKTRLDELHKRKIDLAGEILVLNRGGYVGESTASEIRYAIQMAKKIRWLEPDKKPAWVEGGKS